MPWLVSLFLCLVLPLLAQARSFPATSDPTVADQERWGSFTRGYSTDGCWHGTAAGTSASVASCRAFVLETADPESLAGFEELTARTITYSGGDGTYWLGGRSNPGVTPAGWSCLAGLHYCTLKSATPPGAANGLVVLGKTTVAAGAITDFTVMVPWRRTTPAVIPTGQTVTLGVCPQAERVHIFTATGTTSGLIKFGPGACGAVYPEWWGADPTGLVNSNAAWQQTIDAVSLPALGVLTPIRCEGVYAISATTPAIALTMRRGVHIYGGFRKTTQAISHPGYPCLFNFTGTGTAIGTVDPGAVLPHYDMALTNLTVSDLDDTGEFGIHLWYPVGMWMDNVQVFRFNIGIRVRSNNYYGRFTQLKSLSPRMGCVDFTANVNNTEIDIQCNAPNSTDPAFVGVHIGGPPGTQGLSRISRVNILSEVGSGRLAVLNLINGMDASVYGETPGETCANYDQTGLVHLKGAYGGRLNIFLAKTCVGDLPVGLRVYDEGNSSPGANNIAITGAITAFNGVLVDPLFVVRGAGVWGNDITGLAMPEGVTLRAGDYTTGVRIGENVLTHGLNPLTNEGRGDDQNTGYWRKGDVIWQREPTTTSPPALTNQWLIAHSDGNPPQVSRVLIPLLDPVTVAGTVAIPSLFRGQLTVSRLTVEAGATAITDIADGIVGQCIYVRAVGNRTIKNTENVLELSGSADYAMNDGDTLHLCNEGGIWAEVGRGDNN